MLIIQCTFLQMKYVLFNLVCKETTYSFGTQETTRSSSWSSHILLGILYNEEKNSD